MTATYELTLELGVPIESVMLEGDVEVELLNVDEEKYRLILERPNVLVSTLSADRLRLELIPRLYLRTDNIC